MNNKLICPFCQQELEIDPCGEMGCPNDKCKESVFLIGTKDFWETFIRTRKALDVAVDALDAGKTLADIAGFKMLVAGLEEALEQITALEQKDVK